MSKLILSLGVVVALTAIFVIPSAYTPTQVAKASQCSASNSFGTTTQSKLGSCASSSFASQGVLSRGVTGGSQSICRSTSVAQTPGGSFSFNTQAVRSNGAVSCSSNSP